MKNGGSAQEESLYRCSTLYPTIDNGRFWDRYYNVNREKKDNRHTDAASIPPESLSVRQTRAFRKGCQKMIS